MTATRYDEIAEWYDEIASSGPWAQEDQELWLPALLDLIGDTQGLTVCDLACGQGATTRVLAGRGHL